MQLISPFVPRQTYQIEPSLKSYAKTRFVLTASPQYLEENGVPQSWEDTLSHPTLLYRGPNGVRHWQAYTDKGWHTIETTPVAISNDGIWLLDETRKGKGLCLLPRWGIHQDLADGTLVEIVLSNAQLSVGRALRAVASICCILDLATRSPKSKRL